MVELIVGIAILGLIIWAIITYVPMPEPFKGIIIVIALLLVLAMVFGGGGFSSFHLGRFC